MNRAKWIRLGAATMAIAGALAFWGCGGSGSSVAATRAYLGTQAPGDVWTWNITPTTFSAKNETTNTLYEGTTQTLSTGFLKLTLTSTNSLGAAAGESAYAIELPNTAVLVKLAGADTQPPVVCAALGSNPAGPTQTYNYVAIPKHNYTGAEMAYGWLTLTINGNDMTGTSNDYHMDDTLQNNGAVHFVGDNGRLAQYDANHNLLATAAMAPSGVCAFDYGPGNGGVIGVHQPSAALDLVALANKSYNGFLFESGKTQTVAADMDATTGKLTGRGYAGGSGVETGTLDGGGGVQINLLSQPQPGLVKSRLDYSGGGGSEDMVFAVSQVSGKYVLYGFGYRAADNSAYNVILVER